VDPAAQPPALRAPALRAHARSARPSLAEVTYAIPTRAPRAPVRYDEKQQWYKVRYSDGEKEDMDLHELFEAGVAAGVADTVANARQSDPTLQNVTKERDDLFRKLGVVTEDRNALRAESDRLRAEIDRQDRALACSVCFDRRPNQRWPGGCGHIFCKECLLAQQEACRKSRTVMKCPLCKCCVISGANNIFMDAVATDKA
jgi:hypothetical protein